MIRAANDMADPHVDIVHHDAQVIGRVFVRSQQHKIFDGVAFDGDFAEYRVFVRHPPFGNPEPDGAFVEIRMPAADETLSRFTIQIEPFRLKVRTFIPVKPQPGHCIEDASSHLFAGTRDVGIFDAQDKRALMLSSEQPVEECRSGASNVQVTGWRRSEADANFPRAGLWAHRLIFRIALTASRTTSALESFCRGRI